MLIPLRQLPYNEAVLGNELGSSNAQRFVKGKDPQNSSSFSPFGGGVNHCPGQALAKQEMLVFVALVLSRLDIELAVEDLPAVSPKLDEPTPYLGVNGPIKRSDPYIKIHKGEA